MRVALNMMLVAPGVAGGRIYCEGLLRGLAATAGPEDEFVVFTRRDTALPALPTERMSHFSAPVGGGSFVWRTLWEYGLMAREVRRQRCELLHGLGNVSPNARRRPFV